MGQSEQVIGMFCPTCSSSILEAFSVDFPSSLGLADTVFNGQKTLPLCESLPTIVSKKSCG